MVLSLCYFYLGTFNLPRDQELTLSQILDPFLIALGSIIPIVKSPCRSGWIIVCFICLTSNKTETLYKFPFCVGVLSEGTSQSLQRRRTCWGQDCPIITPALVSKLSSKYSSPAKLINNSLIL